MKKSPKYGFYYTDKKDYNRKWGEIRYPEIREKSLERAKEWYNANKERAAETSREHYNKPENKKKKKKQDKERWEEREKNNWLLRTYGITENRRVQMILEQDNKCARCHLPFEGTGSESLSPVIDHDHSYPKGDPNSVKAIVHNKCNLAMGSHNDDIEELQLSIVYQKKYSKKK